MHKNKLIDSGHPADELPREKMQRSGPETLTDAELLAILLRSGTVRENYALCDFRKTSGKETCAMEPSCIRKIILSAALGQGA